MLVLDGGRCLGDCWRQVTTADGQTFEIRVRHATLEEVSELTATTDPCRKAILALKLVQDWRGVVCQTDPNNRDITVPVTFHAQTVANMIRHHPETAAMIRQQVLHEVCGIEPPPAAA